MMSLPSDSGLIYNNNSVVMTLRHNIFIVTHPLGMRCAGHPVAAFWDTKDPIEFSVTPGLMSL